MAELGVGSQKMKSKIGGHHWFRLEMIYNRWMAFIFLSVFLLPSLWYVCYSAKTSYNMWHNFKVHQENYVKYHEKTSRKFVIIGKMKEESRKGGNTRYLFGIKEVSTGRETSLSVVPHVYMKYEKGDNIWFKYNELELLTPSQRDQYYEELDPHPDLYELGFMIPLMLFMIAKLFTAACDDIDRGYSDDYFAFFDFYPSIDDYTKLVTTSLSAPLTIRKQLKEELQCSMAIQDVTVIVIGVFGLLNWVNVTVFHILL